MFLATLSLAVSVVFFSGYLFALPKKNTRIDPRFLATCFLLGVFIFYTLVLTGLELFWASSVLAGLSALGFFLFLKTKHQSTVSIKSVFLFGFLVLLLGLNLLQSPIGDWDPSAVWFFHAKMIFYQKTLGPGLLWSNAHLYPWSHTDYPKLFPVLVAGFQNLFGIWNEFLPSFGLLFLYIPVVLCVFQLFQKSLAGIFLLIIFFPVIGSYYWAGYLDGYVSAYATLAVLFLIRFSEGKELADFALSILLLGSCLMLKNEGQLIFLAVLIPLFLLRVRPAFVHRSYFFIFVPVILWWILKKEWGVQSEYLSGGAKLMDVIISRITDHHSLKRISESLFFKNHSFRDAIFINLGFAVYFRRLSKELCYLLGVIFLYSGGLFIVYLMTPYDLDWHLETSIPRTTLLMTLLAYAMIYIWIKKLESRAKSARL